MIARLHGVLLEHDFSGAVIDVHGVGYQVLLPLSTIDRLPADNSPVTLLISTQVREDAITLYGFSTPEEKKLFEMLIQISGVGGKLALSILGGLSPDGFCGAINSGDVKLLSSIPGIGKRTAERLVVELKGKLDDFYYLADGAASSVGAQTTGGNQRLAPAFVDAQAALSQLGIKPEASEKVLKILQQEMAEDEWNSSAILRLALQKLNSR